MKRPWNNEGGDGATVATVERTADAADPQARRFKKGFVRVGRMPRGDVVPLFRRAQVKQENAYRLAEFDAAATCTRCAYSARARGPKALERCFRDFAWMECFGPPWQRLVLVSVAPERRAPLDVRVLVRGCAAVPGWEPEGDFAVGFDGALEGDEVRVFMVQYFEDHGLSLPEDRLWRALDSYVPSRIRAAEAEWRRYAEDAGNFASAEEQALCRLEASLAPEPSSRIPAGKSWRSIERTCRMLEAEGASPADFAWNICCSGWHRDDEKETAAVAGNLVRLLEWALAHGSDPNRVHLGMTCLDVLDKGIGILEKPDASAAEPERPEALRLVRRLRDRVLAAGGKRRAEWLADRSPVWLEIPPKAGTPA